jgi:ubiquinone/menaquinone biosynthesis C-methylase UbiE
MAIDICIGRIMSHQQIQTTTSSSEIYERFMVPGIFARWSRVLLEQVVPQPGERVLDLACGTGIVARTAAPMVQPGGEVFGVDMNPAQIATARSIDSSIDWREGDAGSLTFADQELDLIVCQQGFQFFPDRVQAVKEIHRVLKPGGRVGIAVWSSIEQSPGYLALSHALGRIVGASAAGLLDELFAFPDSTEVSRMFGDGGFRNADVVSNNDDAIFNSAEEFTRAIAVGSIMRRIDTQFTNDILDLMTADATAEMEPCLGEDGLKFPMEAHLLTARK